MFRTRTAFGRVLVSVFFCAISSSASAALILSNTPGNTLGGDTALTTSGKAVGFTMGAKDYTLTNVQMLLTTTPTIQPQTRLYSGTPSAPTTFLTNLTNPTFLTGANLYTFTPSTPVTLTAGTTYWVAIQHAYINDAAQISWPSSNPNTMATGPGATYSGAVIGAGSSPTGWSTSLSGFYNVFAVNGTALSTPEPGGLAVAGVAVAGLLSRRRRLAA